MEILQNLMHAFNALEESDILITSNSTVRAGPNHECAITAHLASSPQLTFFIRNNYNQAIQRTGGSKTQMQNKHPISQTRP